VSCPSARAADKCCRSFNGVGWRGDCRWRSGKGKLLEAAHDTRNRRSPASQVPRGGRFCARMSRVDGGGRANRRRISGKSAVGTAARRGPSDVGPRARGVVCTSGEPGRAGWSARAGCLRGNRCAGDRGDFPWGQQRRFRRSDGRIDPRVANESGEAGDRRSRPCGSRRRLPEPAAAGSGGPALRSGVPRSAVWLAGDRAGDGGSGGRGASRGGCQGGTRDAEASFSGPDRWLRGCGYTELRRHGDLTSGRWTR